MTEDTENTFLGAIESGSDKQLLSVIVLNKSNIAFKVNTGAKATAILNEAYEELSNVTLHEPTKILHGLANSHPAVIGHFTGNLTYKQSNFQQEHFVVKGLQSNLLGLPAVKTLILIVRLDIIVLSESSIKQSYSNLFTGLRMKKKSTL